MEENKNNIPPLHDDKDKFEGFTLEDLRYHRALLALKKEFSKSKVISGANKVKKRNPLNGKESSFGVGSVGSLAGKLITGMSYVDYALLGFSIFNTGRKVFSFFRKKK